MNNSLTSTKNTFNRASRWMLMALLFLGAVFVTVPEASAGGVGMMPKFTDGTSDAQTRFNKLREGMQGFAVVVLLIMLVIAAIMAAMQKITMAINVAIAAIILFGGGYIMLLIYSGLQGTT
jgi:hypothetical protein